MKKAIYALSLALLAALAVFVFLPILTGDPRLTVLSAPIAADTAGCDR